MVVYTEGRTALHAQGIPDPRPRPGRAGIFPIAVLINGGSATRRGDRRGRR